VQKAHIPAMESPRHAPKRLGQIEPLGAQFEAVSD
jgi:hypothetical protein